MTVEGEDGYLVSRAQEGYLDAFEQLVQRHSGSVYRVAFRLLANEHDAQDVARKALVLAWQRLPEFNGETSVVIWLYGLVVRAALEKLSQDRSQGAIDEAPSSPAPEATAGGGSGAAVDAALAALPPAERIAVVLHHFEGLTHEDIAIVTASTTPMVRKELLRARRTMSTSLVQSVTIS